MRPDSSGTRARILAAARAEFAEFGLAGARVDRIAEAAAANKRLIYVYFGSKEKLFDTVIEQCLASAAEAVPFDPVNVTAYAAALFDYLVANPETMRLTTWNQLERGENTEASLEVYRGMVRALRAAQRRGQANAGLDPVDLIALVQALARAWYVASPALRGRGHRRPLVAGAAGEASSCGCAGSRQRRRCGANGGTAATCALAPHRRFIGQTLVSGSRPARRRVAQRRRVLIRQFDFHGIELADVERYVAIEAIDDPIVARLMTVPGVDVTVAIAIVASRR